MPPLQATGNVTQTLSFSTKDAAHYSGSTSHHYTPQSNEATLPLLIGSTMGDGRLNDLNMLYINKDTPLDYTAVIDRYAAKQPRRMLLVNPLQEPYRL